MNEYFQEFTSPSWGKVDFAKMMRMIDRFIKSFPREAVRVIIGTDSTPPKNHDRIRYYTVVVVWCFRHRAIYFYTKNYGPFTPSMHQRIHYEADFSIALGHLMKPHLSQFESPPCHLSIDVDAGEQGETRDIITAVVGKIVGNGFAANHKPDTIATHVADRCLRKAPFVQPATTS
jgi:predicted RNase H-related nuclease YkuK (DUF458 family)